MSVQCLNIRSELNRTCWCTAAPIAPACAPPLLLLCPSSPSPSSTRFDCEPLLALVSEKTALSACSMSSFPARIGALLPASASDSPSMLLPAMPLTSESRGAVAAARSREEPLPVSSSFIEALCAAITEMNSRVVPGTATAPATRPRSTNSGTAPVGFIVLP